MKKEDQKKGIVVKWYKYIQILVVVIIISTSVEIMPTFLRIMGLLDSRRRLTCV